MYIYLLGIGGTGVGSLAGLLKARGHQVTGSDAGVYPPMSDRLDAWGIEYFEGYSRQNIAALEPRPDLFVVGNVIRKDNPEAELLREQGADYISMPEALGRFGIEDRHSIVVTGTHGKSTTTCLTAETLLNMERDPSFLVAGALQGYEHSFRSGDGPEFVVEGDEYDTAYFDKGPKFLHYRASTVVITSLEFDHADIYSDVSEIESSFAKLIDTLDRDAHVVVWEGASRARALLRDAGFRGRVTIYGHQPFSGIDLWADRPEAGADGTTFNVVQGGTVLGRAQVRQWGGFGVQNAMACIGALLGRGYAFDEIAEGLAKAKGVRRRMEEVGTSSDQVTLVDDFAHHPTAVSGAIAAARVRYPGRRLWAVFEPRSATTRGNYHQAEMTEALSGADCAVIGYHPRIEELPEHKRFQPDAVVETLSTPKRRAWHLRAPADIARRIEEELEANDVVLVMSNGDFGGLVSTLRSHLEKRT